ADPKDLALGRHLLTQVADQTAVTALLRFQSLAHALEVAAEPLKRTQRGVSEVALDVGLVAFGKMVKNLKAEVLLAVKIVVEGTLGHRGGLKHRLNPRVVVPLLQKNPPAGLQQRRLRLFLAHGLTQPRPGSATRAKTPLPSTLLI